MWCEVTYPWTVLSLGAGLAGLVLGSLVSCWAQRLMHGGSIADGCSHGNALASVRTLLAGVVCGASFALLAVVYGPTFETVELCLLCCVLLLLSLTDLDGFLIPNGAILTALAIRLVYLAVCCVLGTMGIGDLLYFGASALGVGVALAVVVLAADRALGGESMGGGDLKLYAVAALYVGWQQMLFLIMLSCLMGLASATLFHGRSEGGDDVALRPFPFGPSIALALLVTLLVGEPVAAWCLGLLV